MPITHLAWLSKFLSSDSQCFVTLCIIWVMSRFFFLLMSLASSSSFVATISFPTEHECLHYCNFEMIFYCTMTSNLSNQDRFCIFVYKVNQREKLFKYNCYCRKDHIVVSTKLPIKRSILLFSLTIGFEVLAGSNFFCFIW